MSSCEHIVKYTSTHSLPQAKEVAAALQAHCLKTLTKERA